MKSYRNISLCAIIITLFLLLNCSGGKNEGDVISDLETQDTENDTHIGYGEVKVIGKWDIGKCFDASAENRDNQSYLYVGVGDFLKIYDISSRENLESLMWKEDPENFFQENTPPIGNIDTGGLIKSIEVKSPDVFVCNTRYLTIIDTTDPSNPTIESQIRLTPEPYTESDNRRASGCEHIVVKDNFAFATNHNPWHGGIKVIDISDTASPKIVTTIETAPRRIAVKDNLLLAPAGCNLFIYDITDPSSPLKISEWNNPDSDCGGFSSVDVDDKGYAYVIEYHNGIHVIDINDPTNPQEVFSMIAHDNTYNYNDIFILDNLAYISQRYQGFDILDISNPEELVIVSELQALPGYQEGIFTIELPYGRFTFFATDTCGLGIADVSDPQNPQFLFKLFAGSSPSCGVSCKDLIVKDDIVYIPGHNVGTWVVDVSNPEAPDVIGIVKNDERQLDAEIKDNILFVTGSWGCPVQAIDISNPYRPKLLKCAPYIYDKYKMAIIGNYIYMGAQKRDSNWGIVVYDISDPNNIQLVNFVDFDLGFATSVLDYFYKDGKYYLIASSENGLYIIKVSNNTELDLVGFLDVDAYTCSAKVKDNNLAFLACGKLYAINISDPDEPNIIGEIDIESVANCVAINGNYAYVFPIDAYSYTGMKVVDITDPTNMKIVEYSDIPIEACCGVYVYKGLIFTGDGKIITTY